MGQDIDGEAAGDWNGRSISLSSDGLTVAMGAFYNDGNGSNSGHTRVYKFSDSDKLWKQMGQDIDGEAANDLSGISVSLSDDGKTVAIGSNNNGGKGHVRVYKFSDLEKRWIQVGQDIDGEVANDWSGYLVSLSSDGLTVAIGAPQNDGNGSDSGQVRVYKFSDSDKLWKQMGQDIDGEAANDLSGISVSLSSDGLTIAIGAVRNDNNNGTDSGHVRVYKFVSSKKTLQELVDSKTPASGILSPGYRNKDLLNDGFTAAVMKGKGYTATDLKQLDYSVRQMKQARFPLSSLLRAGFLLVRITAYYGAEKFLALGIDAEQLRARGITNERLREMGFDI